MLTFLFWIVVGPVLVILACAAWLWLLGHAVRSILRCGWE